MMTEVKWQVNLRYKADPVAEKICPVRNSVEQRVRKNPSHLRVIGDLLYYKDMQNVESMIIDLALDFL